jgi:8-oxo-dGTP pyrophosphatase MutT (NUDIX family)
MQHDDPPPEASDRGAAVPVRETARVILVDEGHVLLLQYEGPDGYDPIWSTPGGQLEDGETPGEAASRELHEETGLSVDPDELGEPVALSEGSFRWNGVDVAARDVYFVHEHPQFEVDISRHTSREQEHFRGPRWWSLEELTSTTEAASQAASISSCTTLARWTGPRRHS